MGPRGLPRASEGNHADSRSLPACPGPSLLEVRALCSRSSRLVFNNHPAWGTVSSWQI